MSEPTLGALTELFRKLGARNPEGWAQSQVGEGINQLARFVFLREAWKGVVPPADSSWIDSVIGSAKEHAAEPGAGAGPALERMLAAGVHRDDIHELVRVMQWESLASFCYLLEDPGGDLEPEIADLAWALVQIDADGNTIDSVGGLHESVLETDPSGREMRSANPDSKGR